MKKSILAYFHKTCFFLRAKRGSITHVFCILSVVAWRAHRACTKQITAHRSIHASGFFEMCFKYALIKPSMSPSITASILPFSKPVRVSFESV